MLISMWVMVCIGVSSVYGSSYLMLTDLGSSAEMIRRGNVEGFSSGSNAIFENPASLYNVDTASTSVFASQLMNEVSYKNLSIAFRTEIGVISVGYMDAGVDDIPITAMATDGTFYQNGSYTYLNRLAKFGYQTSLTDSLHLGINAVGYLNEIYTYTGVGYSVDAGAIYEYNNLTVSLFGRNLVPITVQYTDSADATYSGEEDLPVQVLFGVRYDVEIYRLWGNLSLMD